MVGWDREAAQSDLRGEGMDIRLREAGADDLARHAAIPIRYLVDRVLEPRGRDDLRELEVHRLPEPWWKDYDQEVGADPALWPVRFDTTTWRVISAWRGGTRVGGVVLFAGIAGMDMLEGREDLALIWDLRVEPAHRGRGVGTRLVSAAVDWAQARHCTELKVETQNINVGACELYRRLGFELRTVERGAYAELPDELQLRWYCTVPRLSAP